LRQCAAGHVDTSASRRPSSPGHLQVGPKSPEASEARNALAETSLPCLGKLPASTVSFAVPLVATRPIFGRGHGVGRGPQARHLLDIMDVACDNSVKLPVKDLLIRCAVEVVSRFIQASICRRR
jgi:hypothetical protein